MKWLFIKAYLSAMIFLVLTFLVVAYIAEDRIYSRQLEQVSAALFDTIAEALESKPVTTWPEEVATYNSLVPSHRLTLLQDRDLGEETRDALVDGEPVLLPEDSRFANEHQYSLQSLGQGQVLKVEEDEGDDAYDDDWIDALLLLLVLGVALALSLSIMIRILSKPITVLVNAVTGFAGGDWYSRAPTDLPPPIRILAQSFNDMADQLKSVLQEQQILIGAIPHELRSPLGRIRFALDLTRQRDTVDSLRRDIEQIDEYLDDMQYSVDEILELNRLQATESIRRASIPLRPILDTLIDKIRQESPHLAVTLTGISDETIDGHAGLVTRALDNVLQNAQRYASSSIQIRTDRADDYINIWIDDDGSGVAKHQLETIFSPFTTLDDSRGRPETGIGLGLSIVRLIMMKHKGTVEAVPTKRGLSIKLSFPV